ncbi:dTTP/UTP pyrophosphatase [Phlebotomus papatasi]|uniref:Uncharacterized protein n=1 Tax=Phlebotomus papatasi TaxID=29031 RepID=A0A1B0DB08_PHLPP|nr:dTTP/UTP pyrophosphatase [Phlebotomus papatasi]
MLAPVRQVLNQKRIVLASGSPRRQELMKNLGINVEICPSRFEEDFKPEDFPSFCAYVEETALHKVLEVSDRLHDPVPDVIIGADTVVTMDGVVYGKPKNKERAFQILTKLMNRKHRVYTGVVIKIADKFIRFTETTDVYFGQATPEQIQAYVDTGEPLDKAGGYGIQGVGGTFIERLEGDYFTVVGLPLYRICRELYCLFR